MVYGYIYKIVDLKMNKVYIGQTTGKPDKRWKDHLKKLKTNTHHSCHLQNSFNKHGNVFSFHILNYATSKKALDKLEMDYIAGYKSTDQKYGYNMLVGGGGVRHTPSMKKHKSVLLTKNNPRYRYDMPDESYLNFLYWDLFLSTGEIAELYDINAVFIHNRLKSYNTVSKSLQNTYGLCRLSRFNFMFNEVTDEPVIIEDYPGVKFLRNILY